MSEEEIQEQMAENEPVNEETQAVETNSQGDTEDQIESESENAQEENQKAEIDSELESANIEADQNGEVNGESIDENKNAENEAVDSQAEITNVDEENEKGNAETEVEDTQVENPEDVIWVDSPIMGDEKILDKLKAGSIVAYEHCEQYAYLSNKQKLRANEIAKMSVANDDSEFSMKDHRKPRIDKMKQMTFFPNVDLSILDEEELKRYIVDCVEKNEEKYITLNMWKSGKDVTHKHQCFKSFLVFLPLRGTFFSPCGPE